jgi:hypothetical protein
MSCISLLILLLTLAHIFCVDCVGSHRKPEGFEEGHAISAGGKEAPELQRDAHRSIETWSRHGQTLTRVTPDVTRCHQDWRPRTGPWSGQGLGHLHRISRRLCTYFALQMWSLCKCSATMFAFVCKYWPCRCDIASWNHVAGINHVLHVRTDNYCMYRKYMYLLWCECCARSDISEKVNYHSKYVLWVIAVVIGCDWQVFMQVWSAVCAVLWCWLL